MQRYQILVAVPARDEAGTITACIESIDISARFVHGRVTVVVAADSCTDETAANARAAAVRWCSVSVIEGTWGRPGAARAAAVVQGLTEIGVVPLPTWIANTDADCVVPPSWLQLQASMASSVDALGGIVRLDPMDTELSLIEAFDATYELDGDRHPHVHGANFGLSADAYRSAGGWCTTTEIGEDHLLWDALVARGHRVSQTPALRVLTSGRVSSRVIGGFATNLALLAAACSADARV